jgi:hypothetical protein
MYDSFLDRVTGKVADKILTEIIWLIEVNTMNTLASRLSDKVEEAMIQ